MVNVLRTVYGSNWRPKWGDHFCFVLIFQTVVHGLTGEVRFDNEGLRTQFAVDIVELSSAGLITVGNWNSSKGLNMTRLPINRSVDQSSSDTFSNRTFVVITSMVSKWI